MYKCRQSSPHNRRLLPDSVQYQRRSAHGEHGQWRDPNIFQRGSWFISPEISQKLESTKENIGFFADLGPPSLSACPIHSAEVFCKLYSHTGASLSRPVEYTVEREIVGALRGGALYEKVSKGALILGMMLFYGELWNPAIKLQLMLIHS